MTADPRASGPFIVAMAWTLTCYLYTNDTSYFGTKWERTETVWKFSINPQVIQTYVEYSHCWRWQDIVQHTNPHWYRQSNKHCLFLYLYGR